MSVVPFRRRLRRSHPKTATPTSTEDRVRRLLDRFQVLALTKPVVAVWLLEWIEVFIRKHLE